MTWALALALSVVATLLVSALFVITGGPLFLLSAGFFAITGSFCAGVVIADHRRD